LSEKAISLYLVPTPIGNLGDITLRALEVLKKVDTILAEDTRTSGVLLKHFQIDKPLRSYHIFNEHKAIRALLERMHQGEVFALVSDAGTPGISDPGFLLVRAALQAGFAMECLPGPTAFIPALVKSGFPTDRFVFEGFLPHKKGRQTLLKKLAEEERTVVFYESPHRLLKTLEQLIEFVGGERPVSVSRELTKVYEETFTATALEVHQHFLAKEVKGEIVVVVHGKKN
jgi:16S rRNA (cytidine1402-2'-O)-methyltransferase